MNTKCETIVVTPGELQYIINHDSGVAGSNFNT